MELLTVKFFCRFQFAEGTFHIVKKIIRQINSKYLLAFIYQIEYNFSNSEIHANECKAYRPTVDLENGPNLIQLNY